MTIKYGLKQLFLSTLLAAMACSVCILYQSQHTLDVLSLAPAVNDDSEINWTVQFDARGLRAIVLETKRSSKSGPSKISFKRQPFLGGLRLLLNQQPIPLTHDKVNVIFFNNDGIRKQMWLQNCDFPDGISARALTEDTVEALTTMFRSK